jgi:hypothetical protein
LRNNDPAGETDVAEARAIQADIEEEYARYGMSDVRRDQAGQASRAD